MSHPGICTWCMHTCPVTLCTECHSVAYCDNQDCKREQSLHVLTDKTFNAATGMPYHCAPCGEVFDDRSDLERHCKNTQHLRLIDWIKGHRYRLRYCDTCRRVYPYGTADAVRCFEEHQNRRMHRSRAKIHRLHRAMRQRILRVLPRYRTTLPNTHQLPTDHAHHGESQESQNRGKEAVLC